MPQSHTQQQLRNVTLVSLIKVTLQCFCPLMSGICDYNFIYAYIDSPSYKEFWILRGENRKKAGSHCELNPGHLAYAASALLLS